ncbi:hypothetical protein LCGC14_2661390, partial [marine sediment metagenome]
SYKEVPNKPAFRINRRRHATYRHHGEYVYGKRVWNFNSWDHLVTTERQYVLDRFRSRFELDHRQVSDQAIWAKYNRLIGGAVKRNLKAIALAVIPRIYKSDTSGVTVSPGMDMKDWRDLGLPFIGGGATRTIYDLGDGNVLKVAINRSAPSLNGLKSNMREAKVWAQAANTDDSQFFAPIIAACPDGSWVIQEKANCGYSEDYDYKDRDAARAVAKKAPYKVHDLHEANFGVIEGRVVIIDYASA